MVPVETLVTTEVPVTVLEPAVAALTAAVDIAAAEVVPTPADVALAETTLALTAVDEPTPDADPVEETIALPTAEAVPVPVAVPEDTTVATPTAVAAPMPATVAAAAAVPLPTAEAVPVPAAVPTAVAGGPTSSSTREPNMVAEADPHAIAEAVSPLSIVMTSSPLVGVMKPVSTRSVHPARGVIVAGDVRFQTPPIKELPVSAALASVGVGVVPPD